MTAYRGYWEKHPPTHLLAAAYVGYKPKPQGPTGPMPEPVELPEYED